MRPKLLTHYVPKGQRLFETNEHEWLGDNIDLRTSQSGPNTKASQVPIALASGQTLTYGQILALGGDFFGIPSSPISDSPTAANFIANFDTLGGAGSSVASQVPKILSILQAEIDAVNAAEANGQQPSTAYTSGLVDNLNNQWVLATGGRYLRLAVYNWDHFGKHAVTAYSIGHQVALQQAVTAHNTTDPTAQRAALMLAYAYNAFADHFMSDLFSGGHIRTPRKELYSDVTGGTSIGGWLSQYMHDEDSKYGLNVINNDRGADQPWPAYGDKRLFDTVDATNKGIVESAVQASADEVFEAFVSGVAPSASSYAALDLIPNIDAATNYVANEQHNYTPMFALQQGGSALLRRGCVCDRTSPVSQMTDNWWGWSTQLYLKNNCKDASPTFPPADAEYGSTAEGATHWEQYPEDDSVVSTTLDASGAGLVSMPVFITSLACYSDGLYTNGAGIVYGASASHYTQYVQFQKGAVTPDQANANKWRVYWHAVEPGFASGMTSVGATEWKQGKASDVIYLDVDTSSAGFTSTPHYFASLMGVSNALYTRGANVTYGSTKNAFRIYVKYLRGDITPEQANEWQWAMAWHGVPQGTPGSGSSRAWKQTAAGNLYVDIDASAQGFVETPIFFSSLTCVGNGLYANGPGVIYNPQTTGFRSYAQIPGQSVSVADVESAEWNWEVHWYAIGRNS
ncbi:MAG: hypothetical protein NXI35_38280 [bacterium]|nr:hypothetical protein [bacterium]